MGVVTINFIEVGSLLFEVTKNFRLFQKIMKRLLRGSSSRSSKEKQKEDMLLPERRQMSTRGGQRPLVAMLQLRS